MGVHEHKAQTRSERLIEALDRNTAEQIRTVTLLASVLHELRKISAEERAIDTVLASSSDPYRGRL